MKKDAETSESTKEVIKTNVDELDVRRLSRWQDTDGRLFVVTGFGYGSDPARPFAGSWQKTDIELLNVHGEHFNTVPYGRFLHYVINGILIPWRDVKPMKEPAS